MLSISNLYEMVEKFNDQLTQTSKLKSHCKSGCSRCCYVDLSVFEVEARHIENWFNDLESKEKQKIKKLWEKELTTKLNFNNDQVSSCVFLSDECCTIYEARPLICRTQGLALMFLDQTTNKKYVDICPLNEEVLEDIAKSEILNLDIINTLLQNINGEENKARVSLTSLRDKLINEND